ncbi:UNKNOWN [Stylonychia lemnae]|uniref:Uncharacterized protein n=1 Tax=Stylonychia lemnae TaxID=5949 RepID=A0A078AT42_STYLE|nr:UNKNOWN [Stylonychia lemnae]|eukprot:CDW85181.1 UNKNOWN [Stylonychia lemnae]
MESYNKDVIFSSITPTKNPSLIQSYDLEPQSSVSPIIFKTDNQYMRNLHMGDNDSEILQSYIKIRDSLRDHNSRLSTARQTNFQETNSQSTTPNKNMNLNFNIENRLNSIKVDLSTPQTSIVNENKIKIIQNIENEVVSKMLLQRMQDKSIRQSQDSSRVIQLQEVQQLKNINIDIQDLKKHLEASHQQLMSQEQQSISTHRSQTSTNQNTQQYQQLVSQNDINNFNNIDMPNSIHQQNNYQKSYQFNQVQPQMSIQMANDILNERTSNFQNSYNNQAIGLGDPRNLDVYSFMLEKSPYNINPPQQRAQSSTKKCNTGGYKPPRSASCQKQRDNSKSNNSFNNSISKQNGFLKQYEQDLEPIKFTPKEAKQSGERLYKQHQIYQYRLDQKKQARNDEIDSKMKDKPTICKKSQQIIENGPSISTYDLQEQLRRHQNCYYKHSHSTIDHCSNHGENKENHKIHYIQEHTFKNVNGWLNDHSVVEKRQSTPVQQINSHQRSNSQLNRANSRLASNKNDEVKKQLRFQSEKKVKFQQDYRPQSEYIKRFDNKTDDNNYHSFGPNIEDYNQVRMSRQVEIQPTVYEPKLINSSYDQGENMLKKLCQQYNMKFDSINQRDTSALEDIVDSQMQKQQRSYQEPQRSERNHYNNQRLIPQKDLKHKKQSSIITKIKQFKDESDNNNSYFNQQILHGKPSNIEQHKVIKKLNPRNKDDLFRQNLRSIDQSYNQVRGSRSRSPLKELTPRYQQKSQGENTYERTVQWKSQIDIQNKIKRMQQNQDEQKDCVFKPQITAYPFQDEQTSQQEKANISYRENQSPINTSRHTTQNYSQISQKKIALKELQKQKYPNQILNLKTSQKQGNDYCSSPHCNSQEKLLKQQRQSSKSLMVDPSQQNKNPTRSPIKKFHIQRIQVQEPTEQNLKTIVNQYLQKKDELKKPKFILKKQSAFDNNPEIIEEVKDLNKRFQKISTSLHQDLIDVDDININSSFMQNNSISGNNGLIRGISSSKDQSEMSQQLEFTLRNQTLQSLQSQALDNISKLNQNRFNDSKQSQQTNELNDKDKMQTSADLRYNRARQVLTTAKQQILN